MDFDFLADPWYQEIVSEEGFGLLPVHQQNYGRGESVITFAGRLFKVSDLKEGGTLLLDFDQQYFANMIDNIRIGQTGAVTIITEDGSAVISQSGVAQATINQLLEQLDFAQDSGYLLTTVEGVTTLAAFSTSQPTGWKIIALVPFHEVSGKIEQLTWTIFILLFLAIVFILILARYLSRTLTNPMRELAQYMKQVEKGDLDVRVPMDRGDEFGLLSSRFNHMLDQVQELQEAVYLSEIRETKLQLLNRETELQALQMQINPHFLHNTLNTMKCVGEVYDVQEVSTMSEGLAEMFKYSVDMEKYKPLKEEINHVKAYIQIIQVRYPDRIRCDFDIPEELEDLEVLKLIYSR